MKDLRAVLLALGTTRVWQYFPLPTPLSVCGSRLLLLAGLGLLLTTRPAQLFTACIRSAQRQPKSFPICTRSAWQMVLRGYGRRFLRRGRHRSVHDFLNLSRWATSWEAGLEASTKDPASQNSDGRQQKNPLGTPPIIDQTTYQGAQSRA